ncbi:hypothetical protein E2C01_005601 [Portunus trituberculatus]|uniref:Uncharacterized protein n=1 Tax=Portunus trituberculatus TaxID=210409 RepID=A0A5B7CSU5_PORTR|nr:hypothetical protein [Portunus trituberculatus]
MLRYVAGVRWQDGRSSSEIAEMCGVKDISVELRKRRLRWFGHMRRAVGGVLSKVEQVQDGLTLLLALCPPIVGANQTPQHIGGQFASCGWQRSQHPQHKSWLLANDAALHQTNLFLDVTTSITSTVMVAQAVLTAANSRIPQSHTAPLTLK